MRFQVQQELVGVLLLGWVAHAYPSTRTPPFSSIATPTPLFSCGGQYAHPDDDYEPYGEQALWVHGTEAHCRAHTLPLLATYLGGTIDGLGLNCNCGYNCMAPKYAAIDTDYSTQCNSVVGILNQHLGGSAFSCGDHFNILVTGSKCRGKVVALNAAIRPRPRTTRAPTSPPPTTNAPTPPPPTTRAPASPGTSVPTSRTTCIDTANGAVDRAGRHCNALKIGECSSRDDTSEFTAMEMCCACGGGRNAPQPWVHNSPVSESWAVPGFICSCVAVVLLIAAYAIKRKRGRTSSAAAETISLYHVAPQKQGVTERSHLIGDYPSDHRPIEVEPWVDLDTTAARVLQMTSALDARQASLARHAQTIAENDVQGRKQLEGERKRFEVVRDLSSSLQSTRSIKCLDELGLEVKALVDTGAISQETDVSTLRDVFTTQRAHLSDVCSRRREDAQMQRRGSVIAAEQRRLDNDKIRFAESQRKYREGVARLSAQRESHAATQAQLSREQSALQAFRSSSVLENADVQRRANELAAALRTLQARSVRLTEDEREVEALRQAVEADKHMIMQQWPAVPPYWRHEDLNEPHFELVETRYMKRRLQALLRDSPMHPGGCQGKAGLAGATVTRVLRIENTVLWKNFNFRKGSMLQLSRSSRPQRVVVPCHETVDADANELFLFHGTDPDTAALIAEHGFDERVAEIGGLYGGGCYFAESSCKSQQYSTANRAGEFTMLYCRVLLGDPHLTNTQLKNQRRAPEKPGHPGRIYDSVVASGGSQVHREFIVYDRHQIYPEFLIYYKP